MVTKTESSWKIASGIFIRNEYCTKTQSVAVAAAAAAETDTTKLKGKEIYEFTTKIAGLKETRKECAPVWAAATTFYLPSS